MGSFTAILRNVSGPQNVDQETCAETIRGMEIIGNSADVKYWAEECIELNPPFEVKSEAAFLADFKPYGKESYYWTVKDHLSAVRVILDDDGDVVHSQDYYAFGLRWDFDVDPEYDWNRIGGLEQTGVAEHLDVMAYRMCDRLTGRFNSVDLLSSSMSRHSGYSLNFGNPINFTDPTGMAPEWIKDEHSDGTVTYTAEDGDSALSLYTQFGEQDGFTADQANEMIEGCLGSNYCTAEGQLNSNVDPGDALAIYSYPISDPAIASEPSSQVPNYGPIGDITGSNQAVRDMDYALDVYEAEGIKAYLYTQIGIAHRENAGSMGRALKNRLG